jgi:hypothetical protein
LNTFVLKVARSQGRSIAPKVKKSSATCPPSNTYELPRRREMPSTVQRLPKESPMSMM